MVTVEQMWAYLYSASQVVCLYAATFELKSKMDFVTRIKRFKHG